MADLKKTIVDLTSSKEYLQYNKYHEGNLFGITKTSRLEHMHSNFLAWLLDSHSGHGLSDFPIRQFLGLLVIAKSRTGNTASRLNETIDRILCQVHTNVNLNVSSSSEREVTFKTEKKRSIDILLNVKLGNKTLPIVIENKVDSSEHDDQTLDYYKWSEKKFENHSKYYEPLYVYLTPAYNNSMPSCEKFILVKYQDMVDYVIEPSLWKSTNANTIYALNMYLQCLSYQTDNSKGENIMAISKEEREILENFYSNNKNLIIALTDMMADDDDVDPELKSKMKTTVSSRDYSKYDFNGTEYRKNRLVLAVVKKYVEDNPLITFSNLEKAFPKNLQGPYGVFKSFSDLKDKEKKDRRFYVEEDDLLSLADGKKIAVCTQWALDNIANFISNAKDLGYVITKK